jgi:hypothetical protein
MDRTRKQEPGCDRSLTGSSKETKQIHDQTWQQDRAYVCANGIMGRCMGEHAYRAILSDRQVFVCVH